jgi:hypothetical protein
MRPRIVPAASQPHCQMAHMERMGPGGWAAPMKVNTIISFYKFYKFFFGFQFRLFGQFVFIILSFYFFKFFYPFFLIN